jgi:hypothetical protein
MGWVREIIVRMGSKDGKFSIEYDRNANDTITI